MKTIELNVNEELLALLGEKGIQDLLDKELDRLRFQKEKKNLMELNGSIEGNIRKSSRGILKGIDVKDFEAYLKVSREK
ncbi:MAG: hypothetical protein IPO83_09415 [Chitinophagaceae bacterium]|nr:hypothetical protein [Chitinophagaceae bacterium]